MVGYLACDNCGKAIAARTTADKPILCPECDAPVVAHDQRVGQLDAEPPAVYPKFPSI